MADELERPCPTNGRCGEMTQRQSGASLVLIGQLLGHTQAKTTQRYAHLFDSAQREAVERAGAVIAGNPPDMVGAHARRREATDAHLRARGIVHDKILQFATHAPRPTRLVV
jgi:hypothetical protein